MGQGQIFIGGPDTRLRAQERLTEEAGIITICPYKMVNPTLLKLDKPYQRAIEPSRLLRLEKSFKDEGFWAHKAVAITEDYGVVDGQHRTRIALALGMKTIPVCIMRFRSIEEEAAWFIEVNDWVTNLSPANYWHGKMAARHPAAVLMYWLEDNPMSLLYRRIAIKGRETEHAKFTVNDVLLIISTVLGSAEPWSRRADIKISQKLERVPAEKILSDINMFVNWFNKCFGKSKRDNPFPFRAASLRAICTFYKLLLDNNISPDSLVPKMQTFTFTSDFLKAYQLGKVQVLVNHYNFKRTKRLEYKP